GAAETPAERGRWPGAGAGQYTEQENRASVGAMQDAKDITIIGAGPTGLFAAFYAGMRGASHRLIDNLDQVGGQLTALYPEKYIFDVAGFPKILAKDLVKALAEQGLQWKPQVRLGEKVTGLRRGEDNGKPQFTIATDTDEYPS